MRKSLLVVAFAALVMLTMSTAASATTFQTSYTFNVDYCTNSCLNGGTGGTITLAADGTDKVLVTVNLSGVNFHTTNGFDTFFFNLNGITSISISNINSNVGTFGTAGSQSGGTHHEDGSGDWMYVLNCTSGCNFLGSNTLSFDVSATGLTTDSFHQLSSGGTSAYFGAAVYNGRNTSCTGVIGANGGTTPTTSGTPAACASTSTPEPASLALLSAGLLGLGGLIRRRK